MGLRLRLHWFDKKIEQGIDYEHSSDFGDDRIIVDGLGLPVAHNINNGYFDVEKHWVPMLQPLFYHWINLENYDYQVAFDYKDSWNIKNNSKKGHDMITEQFISIDKMVGIPLPYPLAEPPEGFFICQGQSFDKEKYPKLARCYPEGKLPDLRGEFIRGWDNGRGVDPVRNLLTPQNDAIRNITANIPDLAANKGIQNTDGAASISWAWPEHSNIEPGNTTWSQYSISLDASRQVPTADENRPRNIAFNYIVIAA